MALAKRDNQNLAILLLDFEKTYHRVDWSFLEGTMQKMGFANRWINGVSSLYKSATSKVMVAGGKEPAFKLSRLVRQGCPMAPFLFFIYAEAMSSFLAAESTRLNGLKVSSAAQDVLDSEFADDTAVFIQGNVSNLSKLEKALEIFCVASRAKLNWYKTVGFWVGNSSIPGWSPHPYFQWIPEGSSLRYLGCQVGIDIPREAQIVHVLNCIHRKLLYWSSKGLSFAGRIIVVNQVLLSTIWYVTSC